MGLLEDARETGEVGIGISPALGGYCSQGTCGAAEPALGSEKLRVDDVGLRRDAMRFK